MTDLSEVKRLIESQGEAWEAFKKANDARLAELEAKGHASAESIETVKRVDADLSKLSKDVAAALLERSKPAMNEKGETPEQAERKAAYDAYLRKGDDSGIRRLIETKNLQSTVDSQGGYLIMPEMEQAIDRVVSTISALPRLARQVTIGSRSWKKRVKTAGMSASWPGEGATSGEVTPPQFAMLEIVVHPVEVEPWVDNETLQDADIDLVGDLTNEAAISFAEGIGDAVIDGNGVGKPRGITSYTAVANASYSWGSIGYIASGGSGAFTTSAPGDKIVQLQHALKQQYRPNARFLMADSTLSTIRQMKDGSGAYYLWQPDPLAGFGGRLLGHPVEVDDFMPVIAANSLSIAFGDFSRAYAYVTRTGIELIRDNVTAKGQTKFNFRRRVGGGVVNFEAVKLMKFASS